MSKSIKIRILALQIGLFFLIVLPLGFLGYFLRVHYALRDITFVIFLLVFIVIGITSSFLIRSIGKSLLKLAAAADDITRVRELAGRIVHEIKNPLGVVLQSVNYLEDSLPQEKNVREILDIIKQSIKKADGIMLGLVDFSRASKFTMRPENKNGEK